MNKNYQFLVNKINYFVNNYVKNIIIYKTIFIYIYILFYYLAFASLRNYALVECQISH